MIASWTENVEGIKKTKSRKLILLIVITSLPFLIGSYAYAATAPDPPTGLSAIAIYPTVVSLSWSPPQHNGSSAITGYKLEWKTPTMAYSAHVPINLGNVTKYNQTALTTGTTYIYRVSAVNAFYTSDPSVETSATPKSTSTPPKNIRPNPPTGLIATSNSATQINLSWNPPADNGGYPVTGYKIQYKIDSGSFANLTLNTGTTIPSYSHTGLSSSHTYTYQVFAINSAGTSNGSNTASAIPTQVATVPTSPTSLRATSASPTSISLSWTAPANSGGSAILGYKIEYKIGTGTYAVLVANTGTSATSFMNTGLTAGTTYTYRVSGINSLGTGSPSNDASAVPAKTLAPSVTAMAVSPTEIDLSWIPPSETYGQLIMGYKIDQKFSSTGAFDTIVDNTGQTTSYAVRGLKTDKTYTFTVTALFSGGGESTPSPEVSATPTSTSKPPPVSAPPQQSPLLPDPPTGLNATIVSPTSVKLLWITPPNVGKPVITGYQIEFKIGSGTWSVLSSNAGTSTSYLHAGLAAGAYFYRVSSISSVGTSTPSTTTSVVLVSNSTIPPPPPIIESSGGMVPVTNTDYSVRYTESGGKVLGITADQTTFSLNIQVTAKSNGTLSLDLPRELVDAKKADGSDDDFIVVTGNQILLKFTEAKGSTQRSLQIDIPAGTTEVTIYGTHVVPEFPISALVLVIAIIPVLFLSKKIVN